MKLKINYKLIFIIFILIPFFKPVGIEEISFFNNLFLGWKFLSLVLIFMILLFNKVLHFNKKYVGFYIYFFIVFFHNFTNNYDFLTPIECILFFFLLSNYINHLISKGESKNLVKAVSFVSISYILLHLISIIIVDFAGISFHHKNYYFLGFDNYSAFFIIPFLTLYLYKEKLNNKLYCKKNILLILIVAFSYYYSNSVTAMVAILFYIILYFSSFFNSKISNIKSYKIILFSILFLTLVIGFDFQNHFVSFFDTVQKDLTFDFRTYFWNSGLEMLKNKPLLGFGNIYGRYYKLYLGLEGHAHNMILEILFTGGIVGFISYFASFISINNNIVYKNERNNTNILNIGIVIFLMLGLMDFYATMLPIYLLLLIVDNDNRIKQSYKMEALL